MRPQNRQERSQQAYPMIHLRALHAACGVGGRAHLLDPSRPAPYRAPNGGRGPPEVLQCWTSDSRPRCEVHRIGRARPCFLPRAHEPTRKPGCASWASPNSDCRMRVQDLRLPNPRPSPSRRQCGSAPNHPMNVGTPWETLGVRGLRRGIPRCRRIATLPCPVPRDRTRAPMCRSTKFS